MTNTEKMKIRTIKGVILELKKMTQTVLFQNTLSVSFVRKIKSLIRWLVPNI